MLGTLFFIVASGLVRGAFSRRMAAAVLAVTIPVSAGIAAPLSAPARPNIIVILADDLGYGDLGCHGQARIKTPNLDKMAAEGMRFTQAYSGSTVCAPSRCALMTGLHTGHAFIRGNSDLALRAADVTIAETLQGAGYYTALIGKWGLGNEGSTGVPNRQGFNEYLGYLDQVHAHDYYTDHLRRYDPVNDYEGRIEFPENAGGNKAVYSHDMFTKAALAFVKIRKPDALNKNRPFFLYLAYTIPHANNEEGTRTGNGMETPSLEPYSLEPWPAPEKGKAAMITRLDADIGRLFERLKESGIDQNTLVLFTSDNGPHKEGGVNPQFFKSSGPLQGIKRELYEGGIRVPMIARWPARVKAGQVCDIPYANWDIPITLAQAAAVTNAPAGDGVSFLPTLLDGSSTNRHEHLYWEFHEGGFFQAVRAGDWKAIRKNGKPLELYDLAKDLGETNNVAGKNPDVIARMEKHLTQARVESPEWPVKPIQR
jgi:arylsulfatase A-like enzyme